MRLNPYSLIRLAFTALALLNPEMAAVEGTLTTARRADARGVASVLHAKDKKENVSHKDTLLKKVDAVVADALKSRVEKSLDKKTDKKPLEKSVKKTSDKKTGKKHLRKSRDNKKGLEERAKYCESAIVYLTTASQAEPDNNLSELLDVANWECGVLFYKISTLPYDGFKDKRIENLSKSAKYLLAPKDKSNLEASAIQERANQCTNLAGEIYKWGRKVPSREFFSLALSAYETSKKYWKKLGEFPAGGIADLSADNREVASAQTAMVNVNAAEMHYYISLVETDPLKVPVDLDLALNILREADKTFETLKVQKENTQYHASQAVSGYREYGIWKRYAEVEPESKAEYLHKAQVAIEISYDKCKELLVEIRRQKNAEKTMHDAKKTVADLTSLILEYEKLYPHLKDRKPPFISHQSQENIIAGMLAVFAIVAVGAVANYVRQPKLTAAHKKAKLKNLKQSNLVANPNVDSKHSNENTATITAVPAQKVKPRTSTKKKKKPAVTLSASVPASEAAAPAVVPAVRVIITPKPEPVALISAVVEVVRAQESVIAPPTPSAAPASTLTVGPLTVGVPAAAVLAVVEDKKSTTSTGSSTGIIQDMLSASMPAPTKKSFTTAELKVREEFGLDDKFSSLDIQKQLAATNANWKSYTHILRNIFDDRNLVDYFNVLTSEEFQKPALIKVLFPELILLWSKESSKKLLPWVESQLTEIANDTAPKKFERVAYVLVASCAKMQGWKADLEIKCFLSNSKIAKIFSMSTQSIDDYQNGFCLYQEFWGVRKHLLSLYTENVAENPYAHMNVPPPAQPQAAPIQQQPIAGSAPGFAKRN